MRRFGWLLAVAVLLLAGCTDSNDATPDHSVAPSVSAVPPGPGAIYYLADAGTGKSQVRSWKPGGPVTALATVDAADAFSSLTVSPDGSRIAWISSGEGVGTLHVANVDGTGERSVLEGVDPYCAEPNWEPDGGRVVVIAVDGDKRTVTWVNVTNSRITPVSTVEGCHFVMAVDASSFAWSGDSGVHFSSANEFKDRKVPNPKAGFALDPESLSAGGTRVAVHLIPSGEPQGDVGRDLTSNAVLETATGAVVTLVPGTVRQVRFLPDGRVLVRVPGSIVLLSASGAELNRYPEPAGLKDAALLTYVPS